MKIGRRNPGLLIATLLVATQITACGYTPSLSPALSPTPETTTATSTPAVPTATLTPTATATATPTATPTPVPTPDPALLLAEANAGFARVRTFAGEAALLCLRYEDTDVDGEPEWIALTYQDAEPSRLSAFVLDGEQAYWLEPAQPKPGTPDVGLGQYATCEVEIRDVNVDGMPEIAIFGHAERNETSLHLFAWDGSTYRRLGRFSGDAGVRFMDADGDLEMEIWEGYRDQSAPSLAWYVIHTWEENTYGWTSDHYDWYFLDRPHSYPTHKPQYLSLIHI